MLRGKVKCLACFQSEKVFSLAQLAFHETTIRPYYFKSIEYSMLVITLKLLSHLRMI